MKYAPSLLGIGQLSGSGGSTTASHNRFGTYFRNRVIPTNPNTTSQQGVRGIFGGFSQAWRSLSESQREGWDSLALNLPRVNSLGQQYHLTGAQLFLGTNALADAVGDASSDDAPTLDSAPVVTSLVLTATSGGTISLAYTASGGAATNNFIIRAGGTRSAGRRYISRSELKQIQVVAGNVASPIDITAAYAAVFGSNWDNQAGMQIPVELFPVSENHLPGVGVRTTDVIA